MRFIGEHFIALCAFDVFDLQVDGFYVEEQMSLCGEFGLALFAFKVPDLQMDCDDVLL